jgi:hypothetical protein
MSFSIFHSGDTYEKANSKGLRRVDVLSEEAMNESARELLKAGRKINGILENFDDELEHEQGVTAPRFSGRRSGRR